MTNLTHLTSPLKTAAIVVGLASVLTLPLDVSAQTNEPSRFLNLRAQNDNSNNNQDQAIAPNVIQNTSNERPVVDVQKSKFTLLPKSYVEQSAADQYVQLKREADQKRILNTRPELVNKLRIIMSKLVQQAARFNPDAKQWRWEVNLLDQPVVNAFCMPGGKIMVYTGIVDKLQLTDDELATVMGHEVSHALLDHARRRMSEQLMQNIGVSLAASFFNLGQLSTSALGKAAELAIGLPHSRKDETDADIAGLELVARAGFNPQAAVNVWRKMSQVSEGQPPQFLSTHPNHDSRIRDIQANLPKVMPLYESAQNRR
jgi:predicted Zn-dependent protease